MYNGYFYGASLKAVFLEKWGINQEIDPASLLFSRAYRSFPTAYGYPSVQPGVPSLPTHVASRLAIAGITGSPPISISSFRHLLV